MADRDEQHVTREPGQNSDGSALRDAQQRLRWYDKYARRALWSYRILALGQLVAAALVPVFVAAGASAWLTAASGAVAAVLTGAQQVLQVGPDSLRLGAARVAVDRELRLYRAQAGPYADPADGQQLLAERVEAVVASETTAWSTRHPRSDEVSGSTGG